MAKPRPTCVANFVYLSVEPCSSLWWAPIVLCSNTILHVWNFSSNCYLPGGSVTLGETKHFMW